MNELQDVIQFLLRYEGGLQFHRQGGATVITMSARNASVSRMVTDLEVDGSNCHLVTLNILYAATMLDRKIGS